MRTTRVDFQEFINERAIVDHGLTHFFSARFTPLPPRRECASGAVILDDHRMVNGQVGRAPIKVFHGVATRSHHLGDELVGFADGAVWVVHKASLNATPFAGKRIGLILSKSAQVETADPLSALQQNRVSTRRTDSLNGSFVLRAKAFAQVHAPSPARVGPRRKPEEQDNDYHPDKRESL